MSEEPLYLSKRRSTTKKVDYNEKKADAELSKKIKQLEKTKPKNLKIPKPSSFKYQSFLQNKNISWNFIPSLPPSFRKHRRFSNILTLEDAMIDLKEHILFSKSSLMFKKNDHIYMISEPPGEPYYIGRVVSFIAKQEFHTFINNFKHITTIFPAKYFQVKINWYYRSRDIQENPSNIDPRLLYASLHNDICPLNSYRGKCTVLHTSEINYSKTSITEYVTKPNTFYFDQLFDRYTLKYYDICNTKDLLKLDKNNDFLKVLNERFPFVFIEEKYPLKQIIRKYILDLDDSDDDFDQICSHCHEWCEINLSIKCDQCKTLLHLYCLDPPLDKKSLKGMVWICFNCNNKDVDVPLIQPNITSKINTKKSICLVSPVDSSLLLQGINKENYFFQYFGSMLISHMSDVLLHDLIIPFPLKRSKIGVKNQWSHCNDIEWKYQPYADDKSSRGTSKTSELLWELDTDKLSISELDHYVESRQNDLPKELNILPQATNFLDMILNSLIENNYNIDYASRQSKKLMNRKALKEPTFSTEEIEKFEKAVAEYGSELHPVCKYVGTQPMSMIVRFYYYWKKTEKGREIWGNFKGRRKNKKRKGIKIEDSYNLSQKNKKRRISKPKNTEEENTEWKHMDDSSFDSEQISSVKTLFKCMFCKLDYSPLWYRVTGGSDDDNIQSRITSSISGKISDVEKPLNKLSNKNVAVDDHTLNALCIRCARLWRRYAVKWQQPLDILKKLNGNGVSCLQSTLETILDDKNELHFTLSLSQIHLKFLEWELVQDTELIVKQRFIGIKEPDKLLKMKRNCMSFHSQLNKSVKRLVKRDGYDEEVMKKDLKYYIDTKMEDLRKKQEKEQKKQTFAKEKHDNVKPCLKKEKLPKNDDDIVNPTTTLNVNSNVPLLSISKHCDTVDTNVRTSIKTISTNGEVVIKILSQEGELLGHITVDSEFKTAKIPDSLLLKLFGSSSKKGISNNGFSDESNKINNKRSSIFPPYQFLNECNIPIIKSHNNSYEIIKQYNMSNALDYKLNVGELTGKNVNSYRFSSLPNPNINIKRKSKSPTPISTPTIDKNVMPLECNKRNFCCICLCDIDSHKDEEIICSNCGLNVHIGCYGINNRDFVSQTISSEQSYKPEAYGWLCNVCSNDCNPLFSTNYECVLCNAKEIDHDSAKKKISRAIPDALKPDTRGFWCHVICAMVNNEIECGCSETYQPIYNCGVILLQNNGHKCDICNMLGGGLVNCDKCSYKFHVTCAQDTPNFHIYFKKTYVHDKLFDNRVIKEGNSLYTIKPCIICAHHKDISSNMLSLDYRIHPGITLFEFYMKNYKSNCNTKMSTPRLRANEQKKLLESEQDCLGRNVYVSNSLEKTTRKKSNKCKICGTEFSIYWFDNICHGCHISQLEGISDYEVKDKSQLYDNNLNKRFDENICQKLLGGISDSNLLLDFVLEKKSSTNNPSKIPKRGIKTKKIETVSSYPTNMSEEINLNNHDNYMVENKVVIQQMGHF